MMSGTIHGYDCGFYTHFDKDKACACTALEPRDGYWIYNGRYIQLMQGFVAVHAEYVDDPEGEDLEFKSNYEFVQRFGFPEHGSFYSTVNGGLGTVRVNDDPANDWGAWFPE